jgi:hypothetical protein
MMGVGFMCASETMGMDVLLLRVLCMCFSSRFYLAFLYFVCHVVVNKFIETNEIAS